MIDYHRRRERLVDAIVGAIDRSRGHRRPRRERPSIPGRAEFERDKATGHLRFKRAPQETPR